MTVPIAHVRSLDHLVITVTSLEKTIHFYTHYLGMKHTTFASSPSDTVHHALLFGTQKINIHVRGQEFEPKAQNVDIGNADLCFLVEEDVDGILEKLKGEGVSVLEGGGVVKRTGARKGLRSVYFRDPDGSLIELSNEIEE